VLSSLVLPLKQGVCLPESRLFFEGLPKTFGRDVFTDSLSSKSFQKPVMRKIQIWLDLLLFQIFGVTKFRCPLPSTPWGRDLFEPTAAPRGARCAWEGRALLRREATINEHGWGERAIL